MEFTVRNVIDYFETAVERHAHEPVYSMWLNLWRLLVKIESPSLESIQVLQQQYASFLTAASTKQPDVVIRFVRADDFLNFPVDTNYNLFMEADPSLLVSPFFIIRHACSDCVEMVVESGHDSFILSAMRAIAPYLALKQGGTMMHASAVCHEGQLYAFLGQSGAGKSTAVKLISQSDCPAPVLTDEAIMVEIDRDDPKRLVGWGTPYGREHSGANLCVPLGSFFFLVQDTDTHLKLLRPAEAVSRLMSCLWCINIYGGLAANALAIAVLISEQVPCYELHFELNNRFWEQIRHLEWAKRK